MRRLSLIILTIIYLLFSNSCESVIDMELPDGGGQLVMFTFLVPDSTLKFHLSRSVSPSSVDDFERVFDGSVAILRNGQLVDSFSFPYRDTWASRPLVTIAEGDHFQFNARDSRGNFISGSTSIPSAIPIETVEIEVDHSVDPNGASRSFINSTIIFNDPAATRNFYQLVILEKIVDIEGRVRNVQSIDFLKDDPVFYIRDQEGSLIGGIDFNGTFADHIIDGKSYGVKVRLPLNLTNLPGDGSRRVMQFFLLTLSEDYFYYQRSRIVSEYNHFFPILDPIRIHSNVSGGLGLIGSVAVSAYSHDVTAIGR